MRALPVSHQLPAADAEPGVLVGVDGSDGSLWALERALQEARAHELPLRVLAAVNPTPAVATAGLEDVVQDSVDRLLAGMADVVQRGIVAVSARVTGAGAAPDLHVLAGDPVALLLSASARQHTLVLGARGNGGFPRLLLGSVASALLFHAQCPVLLVPGPLR
ncbi:universal stress protein [Streptacidiphilus jiangxiensis]|uniref:Nucleotide-binding universal stress protein, UspA family n=1 Tax=Streptacidiphilus jiangxiensis TaxID=235985 RepID=A0A1H7JZX0_STRJI|nr:universal stress protein [Streptacidiphilus jiangxiensis]SEK80062.1 Nucleotide-binding universal stress protein, UspA family [Streptacidiphilus jiangxiensis]